MRDCLIGETCLTGQSVTQLDIVFVVKVVDKDFGR
jgi:hypothetical protein